MPSSPYIGREALTSMLMKEKMIEHLKEYLIRRRKNSLNTFKYINLTP